MLEQYLEQQRQKQPRQHERLVETAMYFHACGWMVVPTGANGKPLVSGHMKRKHMPLITDKPGTYGFLAFPGNAYVALDQDDLIDYDLPDTPMRVNPNKFIHRYYKAVPFGEYPSRIEGCDVRHGKRGIMIPYSWHPGKEGHYLPQGNIDLLRLPVLPVEFCAEHAIGGSAVKKKGYKHISALSEKRAKNRRYDDDRNAQMLNMAHNLYSDGVGVEEAEQRMVKRDEAGYEGTGSHHAEPLGSVAVLEVCRATYAFRDKGNAKSSLLGYDLFRRKMGGVKSSQLRRDKAALLKGRALELRAEGLNQKEIAAAVGRTTRTVRKWFAEEKEAMSEPVQPKPEVMEEPKGSEWLESVKPEVVGMEWLKTFKRKRTPKYRGCEALKRRRSEILSGYFFMIERDSPFAYARLLDDAMEHRWIVEKRIKTWRGHGDDEAVADLESAYVWKADMDAEWDLYKADCYGDRQYGAIGQIL